MGKDRVKAIIRQNEKVFNVYDKHFGRDWKKRFDNEVDEIMMK